MLFTYGFELDFGLIFESIFITALLFTETNGKNKLLRYKTYLKLELEVFFFEKRKRDIIFQLT